MSDNAAKFIMYGMFSLGIAFVFGLVLNAALRPPRAVAQEPRDNYQIIIPKDHEFSDGNDHFRVFNTNTGQLWSGEDSEGLRFAKELAAKGRDVSKMAAVINIGKWNRELRIPKEE